MEEYLDFVSIDVWTMIFTWINLIILFLLLKKFLFKPVNKMLDMRAEEIENSYIEAENAKAEAFKTRGEYEQKLIGAKGEADGIIKSAVMSAQKRSDSIISEANERAKHITEKSHRQIEQDRENAVKEAKHDIASIAVDIAEKLTRKNLDKGVDEKLISDIIDKM